MRRPRNFRWLLLIGLAALAAQPADAEMDISIKAKRRIHVLGEPVAVMVKARNSSRDPVMTHVILAPDTGFVRFFIADGGKEFKEYIGPGWGTRDVFLRPRPIEPRATFDFELELLWNHVVAGDSRMLARELAFAEEGCYQVKATTMLPGFLPDSNVVEVCMRAPVGKDKTVWESFVAEPELARFVQRPIADVEDKIVARVQDLLDQNLSSTYAPYLERALRKHREFKAQVGR